MTTDKDLLITGAILENGTLLGQQTGQTMVRTAQMETERLHREGDNLRRRIEADKTRHTFNDLEDEIHQLRRENAQMRETMREWVASQRGLLALAIALREEAETCPNKGHHKLTEKGLRDDIGEAAADASFHSSDIDDITKGKEGIPQYAPRNPKRKNKSAER